jgi:hypothetical protein
MTYGELLRPPAGNLRNGTRTFSLRSFISECPVNLAGSLEPVNLFVSTQVGTSFVLVNSRRGPAADPRR